MHEDSYGSVDEVQNNYALRKNPERKKMHVVQFQLYIILENAKSLVVAESKSVAALGRRVITGDRCQRSTKQVLGVTSKSIILIVVIFYGCSICQISSKFTL